VPFGEAGRTASEAQASAAKGLDVGLRTPSVRDGSEIWRLTSRCPGLDLNSPYCYLLLCRHFSETCLVAEADGTLKGFITGYLPPGQPDTIFVWQIAVAPDSRRLGLGRRLVDALLDRALRAGVRFLEATVTPSNEASRRLFRAVARDWGARYQESKLFDPELFPDDNTGPDAHEPELLLRLGPLVRVEPLDIEGDQQRSPAHASDQ